MENSFKKNELYYISTEDLIEVRPVKTENGFYLDSDKWDHYFPRMYPAPILFKVKYLGDGVFEEIDTKIRITAARYRTESDTFITDCGLMVEDYPSILDCKNYHMVYNVEHPKSTIDNIDDLMKVIEYHHQFPLRLDISNHIRKVKEEVNEDILKLKPESRSFWINEIEKENQKMEKIYSSNDCESRTACIKRAEEDALAVFNLGIKVIVEQDYEEARDYELKQQEAKERRKREIKYEEREKTRKQLEKLLGRAVPENYQEYIDAHIDFDIALIPLEELNINNIITNKSYEKISDSKRISTVPKLDVDGILPYHTLYGREIKYLGDLLLCDRKRIRYYMQQNKKYIDRLIEYVHSLGCDFLEEKMYPTKPEPDPNLLENCLNVDKNLLNVLNRNNIRTRDELEGIGPAVFYLVGMTDRKREALKKAMSESGISFKTDDMKIDSEKFSVLPSKEEMDKLIEENAVIRARITMKEKLMKDYDYLLNERIQLLAHEQELDSKLAEVENVNSESEGKTR